AIASLSARHPTGSARPPPLLESSGVTDPSQIEAISLLEEPLRRRLYDYVRDRHSAVGRDEAAGACGISRGLAAFHLDRLAEAGILLRNCPVHELLDEHRTLVCAMNHSLMLGLMEGLEADGLTARSWNEPGFCCVEITS